MPPIYSLFGGYKGYTSKKYSNLAAIDCYATIEGTNPYEKTYQDKLDVDNLVDVFAGGKSYNLNKIFEEENNPKEQSSPQ